MKSAQLLLALALSPGLVFGAASASPPASAGRVRIISPEELARELPGVTVLDARDEKEFRAGHVPGSRPVDWRDWTLERPGLVGLIAGNPERWGKLAPADAELERRLRALGLGNGKPIVVVGEPEGWGEEGRMAWALLYWGAADVALLDGGYEGFSRAHPVEKGDALEAPPGDFVVRVRPERRIELPEVIRAVEKGGRPILDARSPEEYAGKTKTGQKRGGHIPGAPLVPQKALYEKSGRYVDAAALRRLLAGALPEGGASGGAAAPITYCTGGVRSALLALLLEARLGVLASNYDGSMWEWSAHPELPLVDNRGNR